MVDNTESRVRRERWVRECIGDFLEVMIEFWMEWEMQQTWGKLKKVVVSSGLHVWSFKSCEEEEECWMMGWQV